MSKSKNIFTFTSVYIQFMFLDISILTKLWANGMEEFPAIETILNTFSFITLAVAGLLYICIMKQIDEIIKSTDKE